MSFVAVGPVTVQQLENLHIKLICILKTTVLSKYSCFLIKANEQEIFRLQSRYYRSYSYRQPGYAGVFRDNDGMKTTLKINLR